MPKRSLTEKLIDGGLHLGKFLGSAVIASSLLGCDHLPKPVSVSEDGRYITYSATEDGKFKPLFDTYKEATLVLYDTERGVVVDAFPINGPPIWPTNTNNTVAYMSAQGERAIGIEKERVRVHSSVFIHSKGKAEEIKEAAFPEISRDGSHLIYTRCFNSEGRFEKPEEYISLILRQLSTGKERRLDAPGIASDFSPDSKNICYVAFNVENDPKELVLYVETLNLLTGDKKRLGKAGQFGDFALGYPRWIDNNRVLFQGAPKKGEDNEIFIATKDGGISRVTDNNLEELLVNVAPDGRVFYSGLNPKGKDGDGFYVAKQTIMGWESTRSKTLKPNKTPVLKFAGENAIFLGDDDEVLLTPITNLEKMEPQKISNITRQVNTQRKLKNLGSAVKDLLQE